MNRQPGSSGRQKTWTSQLIAAKIKNQNLSLSRSQKDQKEELSNFRRLLFEPGRRSGILKDLPVGNGSPVRRNMISPRSLRSRRYSPEYRMSVRIAGTGETDRPTISGSPLRLAR